MREHGVIKALVNWVASMHVISRKRLNEFAEQHPDASASLARWYQLMKRDVFADFVGLRAVFSSADQVGKLTVFNVGGNKFRLIAAIHHNRRNAYFLAL